MSLSYRARAELIDTCLAEPGRRPHLGPRHRRCGAPRPAAPTRSRSQTRLGWLDVGDDDDARSSTRVDALGRARPRRRDRGGLPARHGRQQPLRRGAARGATASRPGHPELYVLDTTDERTISRRRGAARSGADLVPRRRARAAARSKSRRWSGSSGRACPRRSATAAGRQFIAITDPGHGARAASPRRAATARPSSTPPTSADASPRCRSSAWCRRALIGAPAGDLLTAGATMADGCRQENHANAGLELGAFIGAAALGRPRQADGRAAASLAIARAVDRAARRREHRQARQGRAAGRRRAARPARTSTAATAPSSPSPPIGTRRTRSDWPRSKPRAIRSCA